MSGPRRFVRTAASWCTALGLTAGGAGLAGVVGGCQPGTKPKPATASPEVVAPAYEALVQEHNERVARLLILHATGTATLRSMVNHENHTDQADIELWFRADGPRLAVNIIKGAIGQDFVRLGANAGQSWLLDLREDEKVLYVAPSDRPLGAGGDDESLPVAVSPWALLDLMGLTALPPPDRGAGEKVTGDDERDAWVVTGAGRSGPMRIYFDRRTDLPTRVELLSSEGAVRQSSQLPAADYQSVARDGVSAAEFGKFPMRIRLFDSTSAEDSVSISLEEVTARASDPRMTEKVFDLERLKRQFNPREEGAQEHGDKGTEGQRDKGTEG